MNRETQAESLPEDRPPPASSEAATAVEVRQARRFYWIWLGVVLLFAGILVPVVNLICLDWQRDTAVFWIDQLWQRKVVAAEKTGTGPRLIVAGGSSAAFSVDAELLEKRLGLPAVNLGTHGGLGLRHLLEDARTVARAHDTVLLYLEYAQYRRKPLPLSDLERKVIWTTQPRRLFLLPWDEFGRQVYGNMLRDYADGWARRIQAMRTPLKPADLMRSYSTVELSRRGDYRGTAPMVSPAPALDLKQVQPVASEAASVLQEFLDWCKARQIRVIAARPAAVRDREAPPEEVRRAYNAIQPFYEKEGIPILDTSAVFQLPAEWFFDTAFHANAAGQRIVSESLARELMPLFGKPKPALGDTVLLVNSARPSEAGLLAEVPDLDVRYLAATDLKHPLCITVADLSALRGKRVVFAEPEVERMLRDAGVAVSGGKSPPETLATWVNSYPDHLFCLVTVGAFDTTGLADGLAEPFKSFLLDPLPCKTACFGTGRYSAVQMRASGKERAQVLVDGREPWQQPFRFKLPIALFSGSAKPAPTEFHPMIINHGVIEEAGPAGLMVVVLDPERGIVVRRGFLTHREFEGISLKEAGIR